SDRLLGVALLGSLADPPVAAAEARRAHADGLRGGVMLPLHYDGLPLYGDARYEPLWAACAELGLPVVVHPSDRAPTGGYGDGPEAPILYIVEAHWFANRPLWHLIFSGVLERHPGLQLVFTEQGCAWTVSTLAMLDQLDASPLLGWARTRPLRRRPSEYFRRQCWVGPSLATAEELSLRHAIGVDRIFWGSDFPHLE